MIYSLSIATYPMDERCPPYTSPITARPRRRCAYSTPPTLHSKKPPEGGLSSNASQPSLRTEQEEIKHTPRPWYRGEIEIDSGGKAIGSAYILSAEQRGSTL